MLRMILASPRRVLQEHQHEDLEESENGTPDNKDVDLEESLEPWVEWVRRCTHNAEASLAALKLEGWVGMQRRRKWRWASKIANDPSRWLAKAALWNPSYDPQSRTYRKPGRQKKRWSDDIVAHIRRETNDFEITTEIPSQWLLIAKNRQTWQRLETTFITNS